MLELSLFTGIGGGLLGTHGLLGWTCVGAVEWEEYPCRVLRQRQLDGALNDFPIWHMDIREFNRRIAPSYTGLVDVITAGFPCQPFSLAGKQQGADDERNQWPATIECVRVVRPRFVMLENVPGLISNGYLGTVLSDLAACGYDARWRVLSAAELGAPHKRDRLWIVANATGDLWGTSGHTIANASDRASNTVSDSNRSQQGRRVQSERGPEQRDTVTPGHGAGGDVANATSTRRKAKRDKRTQRRKNADQRIKKSRGGWWATEPAVGRVAHGVASRVDRLKAIGNGQVPAVAAAAWLLLTGDDA